MTKYIAVRLSTPKIDSQTLFSCKTDRGSIKLVVNKIMFCK